MPNVTREAVLDALRKVDDPDLHRNLVELNMVRDVVVEENGDVFAKVELTTPACPLKAKIKADCEAAIGAIPGVGKITIEMGAMVRGGGAVGGVAPLAGVKNIVAVGSGKGGVGKSTTAVSLAIALHQLGATVAVLDADIYGPNVPGMMGASGRPRVIDNKMLPIVAHGVSIMSMGFLVAENTPLVWRGPMLHGVLRQLIHDVNWGEQDYLIIDLPPGTGDVQLSLVQTVPLAGAVVVTTPQNVALQDAQKGIAMFQQTKTPILGIIENMSFFLCPKCGHREEIFSHQGGENAAKKLGVPFLGGVPLNTAIREGMDVGRPAVTDPGSDFARVYREIASRVAQQISILNAAAPPPPPPPKEKGAFSVKAGGAEATLLNFQVPGR